MVSNFEIFHKNFTVLIVYFKANKFDFYCSILCKYYFISSGIKLGSFFGRGYENELMEHIMNSMAKETKTDKLYFPFYPWTPIVILMNVFPYWIITVSICLIILCLYLLFSIQIHHNSNIQDAKKNATQLVLIGNLKKIVENVDNFK